MKAEQEEVLRKNIKQLIEVVKQKRKQQHRRREQCGAVYVHKKSK